MIMTQNTKSILFVSFLASFCVFFQAEAYTPTAQTAHARVSFMDPPPPANRVQYYGGTVLSAVKIYAVFWGPKVNQEVQTKVGDFYAALADSTYFDLFKQYGTKDQSINHGTFVKAIVIKPINTSAKLEQKDVEDELVAQFDQGTLPKPDSNSLYMVHFPPKVQITAFGGHSCQQWCGDHEAIKNNAKYGYVAYAMIPDMGGACSLGCYGDGTPFSSITIVTSHEVAEAVTDPVSPGPGETPAFPAGWITSDANEIGDLCVSGESHLKTSTVKYLVQDEWDNSTNACKNDTFTSNL